MAVEHSGRLELTWTNKHLRPLANQEGGYQWVPPADYRVAEVRLLHDLEEVGETRAQRSRAKDNLLVVGDALNAVMMDEVFGRQNFVAGSLPCQ